jgi:predicted O-methyltransferase YrrM
VHLPWRPIRVEPDRPPILTSLTVAEADTLMNLAAGRSVLEVGSAYGFSTVTMALTAAEVVAVDPHWAHNSHEIMTSNLTNYRVQHKVDIRRAVSQTELPALHGSGYIFDLIFIDGDHATAGVTHDIEWALKLVAPGGTIAVHDVLETCCCPEVGPVVDELLQTYELVDTMALVTV